MTGTQGSDCQAGAPVSGERRILTRGASPAAPSGIMLGAPRALRSRVLFPHRNGKKNTFSNKASTIAACRDSLAAQVRSRPPRAGMGAELFARQLSVLEAWGINEHTVYGGVASGEEHDSTMAGIGR